jgi:DNA-binding MarR family transcriptional regulator
MQEVPRQSDVPAFQSVEHELVLLLRLLQSARHRRPRGAHLQLEQPAYSLLAWLHDHGECRSKEVAEWLCVDASSVSRLAAALERDGLLTRDPDPTDGRAQRLRLTPRGERTIRAERSRRWALVRQLLDSWPAADRERFAALLAGFNEDLRALLSASQGRSRHEAPSTPPTDTHTTRSTTKDDALR